MEGSRDRIEGLAVPSLPDAERYIAVIANITCWLKPRVHSARLAIRAFVLLKRAYALIERRPERVTERHVAAANSLLASLQRDWWMRKAHPTTCRDWISTVAAIEWCVERDPSLAPLADLDGHLERCPASAHATRQDVEMARLALRRIFASLKTSSARRTS